MEKAEVSDPPDSIAVTVKFSGRSIPITISQCSTVKDLKSILQPLTNVLIRGQKLIFKGKLLVDEMTLTSSEVTNGSKIMLMASQGLHQGDGPIKKENSIVPSLRSTTEAVRPKVEKTNVSIEKTQLQRWKATGVIALSESNLKAIPEKVWACGASARVLDLSQNFIRLVPSTISCLSSLQKLLLNANDIVDESLSWEGLMTLKSLTTLSLSQNHLTFLPPSLGALSCVRQLNVANNRLTCLPAEIELLTELQILKASNNRLSTIPRSIGRCGALVEVDLSSNLLVELPETIGNLQNLQALHLHNNGLKYLPASIFKMCTQLTTLDLRGTEVTNDLLRQFEGWESFDERRRSKHQKQLDFRVGDPTVFDEGADKN